jgi:uncharacterized membrane protein YphA (DoxX/SURF4 family)
VASALLTAPFWLSGLFKLVDFKAAKAETQAMNLRQPALSAAAVILIQLIGSGLVISGRWVWIGAAVLAAFTLAASLVGHAFWNAPDGADRTHHLNAFLANLGLVGGLALAVVIAESSAL